MLGNKLPSLKDKHNDPELVDKTAEGIVKHLAKEEKTRVIPGTVAPPTTKAKKKTGAVRRAAANIIKTVKGK